MRKDTIKKIAVFDQGHPVAEQLMAKAESLFDAGQTEFVRIAREAKGVGPEAGAPDLDTPDPAMNHMAVISSLAKALREEDPDLVLIGATALGEEVAPALGIRLHTGVAAHCIEIGETDEGEMAFMVPAFGGKVIGEILIPESRPMIATVKPGTFSAAEHEAGAPEAEVLAGAPEGAGQAQEPGAPGRASWRQVSIDPGAEEEAACRGVKLVSIEPKKTQGAALDKAQVIVCGGFGIGSAENWRKIEELAEKLGGAAGCTRPVVDMGWGPDEDSMIGTSGRTVKPKVYLGFGISGAAHHLCGIRDAGVIISINSDKEAEVFRASDHCGVFDAGKMLDLLLVES